MFRICSKEFDNSKNLQIVIIICSIVLLMNYKDFLVNSEIGYSKNIFDFIFYIISNFYLLSYFFPIIFLLLIYNIFSNENYYQYSILRYDKKINWYRSKLFLIGFNSIICVVVVILICVLIGLSNLDITTSSLLVKNNKFLSRYSFGFLLSINLFFMLLYFNILGLIYMISVIRFRSNIIGFLISYGLSNIVLHIVPHFLRFKYRYMISLVYNVALTSHSLTENNLNPSFSFSLIYFNVITVILIIIGYRCIMKTDLVFKDDSL